MPRIISGWFEFNGKRSDTLDVRLMDYVTYARAEQRGKSLAPAGRSGDVWHTDGAYETVEIKRKIRCRMSKVGEVSAWLSGSGLLIFSWAPNLAHEARIEKKLEFKQVTLGSDPLMECTVPFTCQPYRVLVPEAEAFTVTSNGFTFPNPGTAPSLPRVKITGSGDFSVTIGMETLFFSDVTGGGIIVDSLYMDAFTYDGAALANDNFEGTPFQIQPGQNTVSWLVEDGSSVSSIEILPRWRYV